MRPPRRIRIADETLVLAARAAGDGGYDLRVGEETLHVEAGRAGSSGFWFVTPDGVRHTAFAAVLDGHLQVRVDGRTWLLASAEPEHRSTSTTADPTEIIAPMTGTIVDVLCQPGDTVTKNQDVIVLNAMKMEHRLAAACDAEISEISAKKGATVEAGTVLARLVP